MENNKNVFETIKADSKKYIEKLNLEIEVEKNKKIKFLYWKDIEQYGIGLDIGYHENLVKIHLVYYNKFREIDKRLCSLLIDKDEIKFCSFHTGEDTLSSEELGKFLDKNFDPICGTELFSAYFSKTKPIDNSIWKSFKSLVLEKIKLHTKTKRKKENGKGL